MTTRTQLITNWNSVQFQESLNSEIRAIEKQFFILEIMFSTAYNELENVVVYSALIIYRSMNSQEEK